MDTETRNKMFSDAEAARREKPSMDCRPLEGMMDYGEAGTFLDNGIAHWDESIPTGQKLRTELAAQLIVVGITNTLLWLRAKGYDVPVLVASSLDPNDIAVDEFADDIKRRIREKGAQGKTGWQDNLVGCLQGYFKHMSGGHLTDAGAYLAFLRAHGLTSTPVHVKGPIPDEFPVVHATGPLNPDSYVVSEGSSVTADKPAYDNAPDLLGGGEDEGPSFHESMRASASPNERFMPQGNDVVSQASEYLNTETPSPSETLNPTNSWPFSGPATKSEAGEGPSDPAPEHPDKGHSDHPTGLARDIPIHGASER